MGDPIPETVSASLADRSLAIGLGANLGDPRATFLRVRPLLEALVWGWWRRGHGVADGLDPERLRWRWSPLFRTTPQGGPSHQPPYLNAVLLVESAAPVTGPPRELLQALHHLENRFGRRRIERWGPRTLDLDLLWCGRQRSAGEALHLPHPRLAERSFVLAPLAAIDSGLAPPLPLADGAVCSCGSLLARLPHEPGSSPPARLPPRPDWPE